MKKSVSGGAWALLLLLSNYALGQALSPDSSRAGAALGSLHQHYAAAVRGGESRLYNGPEYLSQVESYLTGHPFFESAQLLDATVEYGGATYAGVPLRYDLMRDLLVLPAPAGSLSLQLVSEKVSRFTLSGHTFIRLAADSASGSPIRPGFYDLLADGPVRVLAARKKTRQRRSVAEGMVGEITQRNELFVYIVNSFVPPAAGRAAPLTISERWAADVQRRHVQAEVERAYVGPRPVRYQAPPLDTLAFYGQPSERYFLDRYTRFKVMEEVMREYVPGVLVRIRKDGFHFLVPDYDARTTRENPLVLLDGVPVSTNRIMGFDPLKVQRLDVITRRYFLGPSLYNGVVSYSTYRGDLGGFAPDPHVLLQAYEGLQGQRDFYAPRYETPPAVRSRRPDFRNLLYWNPELPVTPGVNLRPTFYTSDQAGRYRVVIQGLTNEGLAGSTSFTFEVKPAL